jgi:hypothetical protein
MGAEDYSSAGWYFTKLFDEHGPCSSQFIDHMPIVNNLFPHIDGCAVYIQGDFYYIDRTDDTRAKTARSQQKYLPASAPLTSPRNRLHITCHYSNGPKGPETLDSGYTLRPDSRYKPILRYAFSPCASYSAFSSSLRLPWSPSSGQP